MAEVLVNAEALYQSTVHLHEAIESGGIVYQVLLREVVLVVLDTEVLVNLGLVRHKVTPDFLNLGLLEEDFRELQLVVKVGVVPHQELSKENSWVKSF